MMQSIDIDKSTRQDSGPQRHLGHELRHYWYHVRQFSRNARLYLLAAFLLGVNYEFFQLLLNLYLKELGFGESNIGLINSSRAVGMSLMAIPAAIILSRINLKPVLIASGILFAIFSVGVSSNEPLQLILIFSVLSGMTFAFSRVAAGPFYMRNSTSEERTHLFSFSFGVLLLAGMVGSLTAGRLVPLMSELAGDSILGYRYTLYLGIAIGMLALIPFAMLKPTPASDEERRIKVTREQFRRRGTFYFKISFSNFLIGLGAGLIIPFLNLYFRDKFGLSTSTIGFFYFCTILFMFAGTLAGPVLARRYGLVRTIVFTQLLSIPFMLTLAYTQVLWIAFAAYVLRAGLMNIGVPVATNFGMEMSSRAEQGLVNALLMVSWTSSWMLSTAVGGRLIEQYGYTLTFNITIVLYILSTLFYFWSFKGVEKRGDDKAGWAIAEQEEA
ncbi:MAG: MFS transporter [candidate division Zixibacteria bacterium]|nr:MFS transporter [candidate division Zixibacteria bacterium]